jgi:hypothetical protein
MMRPNDPDVGQFNLLLADLAELQAGRTFAKAMAAPPPRPTRREFVPRSYFSKSQPASTMNAAAPAATAADLARAVAGIERLAVENRKLAQAQMGEKRARLRQQAADLLRRAMVGLGRGEITAIEVAGLEARVNRFLSALDQQPASVRARIAI